MDILRGFDEDQLIEKLTHFKFCAEEKQPYKIIETESATYEVELKNLDIYFNVTDLVLLYRITRLLLQSKYVQHSDFKFSRTLSSDMCIFIYLHSIYKLRQMIQKYELVTGVIIDTTDHMTVDEIPDLLQHSHFSMHDVKDAKEDVYVPQTLEFKFNHIKCDCGKELKLIKRDIFNHIYKNKCKLNRGLELHHILSEKVQKHNKHLLYLELPNVIRTSLFIDVLDEYMLAHFLVPKEGHVFIPKNTFNISKSVFITISDMEPNSIPEERRFCTLCLLPLYGKIYIVNTQHIKGYCRACMHSFLPMDFERLFGYKCSIVSILDVGTQWVNDHLDRIGKQWLKPYVDLQTRIRDEGTRLTSYCSILGDTVYWSNSIKAYSDLWYDIKQHFPQDFNVVFIDKIAEFAVNQYFRSKNVTQHVPKR